jgi:hypothetical protein
MAGSRVASCHFFITSIHIAVLFHRSTLENAAGLPSDLAHDICEVSCRKSSRISERSRNYDKSASDFSGTSAALP